MKASFLSCVLSLLFACGQTGTGQGPSFPGKYTLYATNEFGSDADTVIISASSNLKNVYDIDRNSWRVRIGDGKDSIRTLETTHKSATFNPATGILVVTDNLEEIALLPGKNAISYAGTTYARLKE